MTARLKNCWLWVGALWAGVVLLFGWNHHTIDTIAAIQAQNLNLRSELLFQHQNATKLERIQNEVAKLFLASESLQLGVLSVKGQLTELAGRSGLNVGQMAGAPLQKGAETATLNLTLSGPLQGVLQFLAAVNAQRYLLPQQVAVRLDLKNGDARCELALLIRCRVQTPVTEEPTPGASNARAAL